MDYLSDPASETQDQFRERLRQAANGWRIRGFSSYREAELHGYYSLKRLKEMGLFVPDSMRPYYQCVVESKYGRHAVYSKQQCVSKDKADGQIDLASSLKSVERWLGCCAESPQVVAEAGAENGATVREPDPCSTTTTRLHSSSLLPPFDVQNIASDVGAKDLGRKSQLERSEGSGETDQESNRTCTTTHSSSSFSLHLMSKHR